MIDLAREAQQRLAGFGGLHMTPLERLHMTTMVAGPAASFTEGQLDRMARTATSLLTSMPPVSVMLGRILYHPEAIMLGVSPSQALIPVREAALAATRMVTGGDGSHEDFERWVPHITLCYRIAQQPAAPLVPFQRYRWPGLKGPPSGMPLSKAPHPTTSCRSSRSARDRCESLRPGHGAQRAGVMWCGCHTWRRLFRQHSMGIRGKRVAAALLALSAADPGLWASIAPRSFFRSFPGGGHHWVSVIGPYDEHLVRDVGGLYLSLLAVSVWAVVRPRSEIMRLAGVAWLVFSLPHLAFHAAHLDPFGLADQVGEMVALGGTVVLAMVLLLPGARRSADTDVACQRAAPSSGGARAGKETGEAG